MPSPRKEFFYWNDDGSLVALRVNQWKIVFQEQRENGFAVPDGEKLAWLVTGHGLANASGTDIALLQAAAGTLINSKESIPLTQRIARQIGLDDIGMRSAGSSSGTLDSQSACLTTSTLSMSTASISRAPCCD